MAKCFIDVETTGLTPFRNEVITMGVVIADQDLRVKQERQFKFRPNCSYTWSLDAERVHGISWDESQDFPDPVVSLRDFFEYINSFGDLKNEFIYHALTYGNNISGFDYQHVFALCWMYDCREIFYGYFPESLVASTIERSRKLATEKYGIKSQGLASWIEKLQLKGSHHDSLFDARACYEIYKYKREYDGLLK